MRTVDDFEDVFRAAQAVLRPAPARALRTKPQPRTTGQRKSRRPILQRRRPAHIR